MENLETIVFTISLLLLVISISLSPIIAEEKTTNTSTLICMILVAVTTFLETLSQQTHNIPNKYKKIQFGVGIFLIISVLLTKFFNIFFFVQSTIVGFLVISIIVSMLIIRKTKPRKQFQYLEKSNRIFGIVFLTVVPVFLFYHYGFEHKTNSFPLSFLLYFSFIAMAIRKIYDDLQRLSITNKHINPKAQQFKNYGLTQREQEIATLLFEGLTYQDITRELHISLPTVKTHASNIYKKCSVNNRNELSRLLMN